MQTAIPVQQPRQQRPKLPDLQPFLVDPLILGTLNRARARRTVVFVGAAVLVAGTAIWSAISSNLFLRPAGAPTIWHDVWTFITLRPSTEVDPSMPLLRDYPSLMLTITVIGAIGLVYSLFRDAQRLHRDLEGSGCVKPKVEANRANLSTEIDQMNARFERLGKFAPLALVISILFMLLVNLSAQSKLFAFLGPNVYGLWWASLTPLRPGGIVWVLFGGIGIYMVYVEAVLGLTYVAFLRAKHKAMAYDFNANMLNPDGFFGWYRLRRVITNLQTGLICTLLSAWAVSFFLYSALGIVATIVVLAVFVGITGFVYYSINAGFRREVRLSKSELTWDVVAEINEQLDSAKRSGGEGGRSDLDRRIHLLEAYSRLEYISRIPTTPIRQRWLLAGAVSVLGTLSAIVIPLIQYLT